VVNLFHRGDSPTRSGVVEVAQTLNCAADGQARTGDAAVPPGQFRYVATHALNMVCRDVGTAVFAVRVGSRTAVWVPADPTQERTSRESDTGEGTWLIGSAEQAHAAGMPDARARSSMDRASDYGSEGLSRQVELFRLHST
jgi:hypothetical protein